MTWEPQADFTEFCFEVWALLPENMRHVSSRILAKFFDANWTAKATATYIDSPLF